MMLKPIGDFKIGWEKSYFKLDSFHGEVTEWLNVAVSKTVVRESVPRVRIPPFPPAMPLLFPCGKLQMVGFCAIESFEPCQVLTEAALRSCRCAAKLSLSNPPY